ncbi:hypothetical protein LTR35_018267 [Friedmanniomyces endolithicus]|nr:hypothetical protein LTR35_018267 [Friedmanniomyces endolithicus]
MCTTADEKDRTLIARPQRGSQDPSHVLPPELLFDILRYLEATSLVKASAVSWQWRALCLSPYLWKVLYLRAGWQVTDKLTSTLPDSSLCVRQSRQITLDGVSQGADVPWHFLFRQRTRLKDNWDAGRFVRFRLPHPNYAAEGHTGTVYAIQQCGRQLVSGGADGTVRRWDLDSQRLIGRALRGHHGRVYALHFDGRKDIIISGSSSAEVFVWRFSSGELLQTIPHAHDSAIVSLHSSGGILATGSMDNNVKVWKRCSSLQADHPSAHPGHHGRLVQASILKGHVGGVTAVYVHENNIVSSSGDLRVKVWSINTGECLRTFSNPEHVASVHVAGQKIGKGAPHAIQIIDHTSGETVATLCKTSQTLRTAYAKLEKGRCVALVSGSLEEQVTIWKEDRVKTWSPLRQLSLLNDVETLGDTSSKGQALNGVFSTQQQQQHDRQRQQQEQQRQQQQQWPSQHWYGRNVAAITNENTPNIISRSASNVSGAVSGARGGVAPLDGVEIRKPRIYHVQLDERRITCCSTRFGIVGWDFGNGDKDIQLASRFFP